MRVVLDTNVLVSGLLWDGPPNQLLKWGRDGMLEIISCEAAVAEAKRVIEYPKFSRRISALDTSSGQILAYLMNLVTYVPPPTSIIYPPGHCRRSSRRSLFGVGRRKSRMSHRLRRPASPFSEGIQPHTHRRAGRSR